MDRISTWRVKIQRKRDKVGIFPEGAGASSIPTFTNHNANQKVNVF